MKDLSTDQKTVISAVQFRARTPIRRIATETGLDHRKVRSALKDLIGEGRIYPVSRVSYANLGLVYHVVWGILLVSARQEYDKVLDTIRNHPNIAWASSCWGDFDLEIGIVAGNEHQAQDVLSSLGSLFSHTLRATERYSLTFVKSYLSGNDDRKEAFFGSCGSRIELDELDFTIVESFQVKPLAPYNVIAETIGVPENTVRTRATKLTKHGVLVGTHYFVQLQELGLGSCRILVQFHAPTLSDDEQMKTFCRSNKSVTALGRYAGSYDYELSLEGDLADFRRVKDELARIFQLKIRSMTTIPVEATLKCTFDDVRTAVKRARENSSSSPYASIA